MNRIIISTAFILSVTACASGLSRNSAPAATSRVPANADLVGRITNSNGIRDDVNDYILTTFANDPKKRTAAIRLAQSNQRVLEAIAENRPVTQDLITKISYAGLCFAQNMDKKSFMKQAREITARTFNTEARFRAHDEFSKQAYGMSVATSDNLDACEAAK
jgi:hypothetical protein